MRVTRVVDLQRGIEPARVGGCLCRSVSQGSDSRARCQDMRTLAIAQNHQIALNKQNQNFQDFKVKLGSKQGTESKRCQGVHFQLRATSYYILYILLHAKTISSRAQLRVQLGFRYMALGETPYR